MTSRTPGSLSERNCWLLLSDSGGQQPVGRQVQKRCKKNDCRRGIPHPAKLYSTREGGPRTGTCLTIVNHGVLPDCSDGTDRLRPASRLAWSEPHVSLNLTCRILLSGWTSGLSHSWPAWSLWWPYLDLEEVIFISKQLNGWRGKATIAVKSLWLVPGCIPGTSSLSKH